jgi:xylan 1,4-beta-xylosidase
MKALVLLAFAALVSLSAAETPPPPTTYQNPVLPGFFPDPSLVRVGEDYYLVNSTFQYFPAILISHSKDLVHWKQIGHVFSDPASLDLTGFDEGCGIWAPDISYHDGDFYIFYCLVQLKKDRSVNVRGNYVTRSKSISGPWSKPVQLTEEGNDPSHFVDDDGTHYMLYAGGIPKGSATKISKLNADCTKVVDGPHWIDYGGEKRAPEGPHLFKKDGWYYHTMAASGGIYDGHHQLIARSRNVLGPYEASPHNPFIAQMDPKAPIQHHGHAKLVKTQNNEWWALYLCQRRLNGFSTLGRETGLDRVDWQADGWPVINGGKGPSESNTSPKLPFTPQQNPRSDEFDGKTINLPWQWVRNPSLEAFSLTKRPGFLRLHGSTTPVNAEHARHILLQREVSHHYTATTRLEFKPRPGDEAGLLCYYDSACHIKFALTDKNGPHLQVEECRKGVNKVIAGASLDPATDAVFLKVEVNGLRRGFSYSRDNKAWHEITTIEDASFLSDQATPKWGFTGTMVGLFATRPPESAPFSADFDFFHHDPQSK